MNDTSTIEGVQKSLLSSHERKDRLNKYMETYIFDDLHPEDNAMLQALYSRSPNSVMNHIDKVKGADSGNFMKKYYVGYGHLSIADCGSTTIFIENVSMFIAKAIQDWPLYSGQEASTRYLDYSQQPVMNPAKSEEGKEIQDTWMEFYTRSMPKVIEHMKTRFPIKEGQNEKIYQKAIEARSFDVMRGFLPSGSTTYLSWHTNLRQAYEKLALLEHHPLVEMREVAQLLRDALSEKYQNSFNFKKYPKQQEYFNKCTQDYSYFDPEEHPDFEFSTNIKSEDLEEFDDILKTRPEKTNLPVFMGSVGQFNFKFLLDFGSFRDIQRHRNGECKMPLVTTRFGFSPWYLAQLPEDVRAEAKELISKMNQKIEAVSDDKFIRQYYIPMGYLVPIDITYRLPAAIYVAELRAGKTVHPTLRTRAQQMGEAISNTFPGISMHHDMDESDWDIKRGEQDIIKQ